MPERIVRPGILSSEAVARLSWGAEVFYRRLMSVADDYGRFDGRVAVLRAALYPLQIDRVREADVTTWRRENAEAGCVRLYSVDGREYIQIEKFNQRIQGRPKWPEPPPNNVPGDSPCPTVNHSLYGDVDGDGDGDAPPSRKREEGAAPAWSREGGWVGITAEDRTRWGQAYPACDLDAQLARMHEWLLANPREAQKSNWRRFITNWLARAQDRGGDTRVARRQQPPGTPQPTTPPIDDVLDRFERQGRFGK